MLNFRCDVALGDSEGFVLVWDGLGGSGLFREGGWDFNIFLDAGYSS